MSSVPPPDPGELADVEALLARARPLPRDEFVHRTERRLLGRPSAARAARRRVAAVGLAGALATLAYVFGAFGGGPLSLSSDDVRAGGDCPVATVELNRSTGVLVLRDGRVIVVPRPSPVTSPVDACP